ncbi:MAG: metal-dependent hydrolase [Deltaproteobacteria bacterium]|nr:metal-dependent hydrolase [Deltaproteobacteria bacterium]
MMMVGLIGALAPDVDVVAGLWDPMAAITVHRTATHSFLGGVVIAAVVAGLLWSFRRESFASLFGFAYLGLLSHMGSDLLTSFGIAILWPLTDWRFALAQHYIIDPIFSIIVVTLLTATFRCKRKRESLARGGLIGVALYVLATAAHKEIAVSRWHALMDSQGTRPIRSVVLPLFPGPFRWLGVSETEKGFYQQSFRLYGSKTENPHFFSKNNEDFRDLERLREVQAFLSFARFPWKQEVYDRGVRLVEYRDLAFADHPLGGPLSLRIWLYESGAIKKMELGHRF